MSGVGSKGLGLAERVLSAPFILVILVYRVMLSPLVGMHCRFEPTCSRYALAAYREHGAWRGTLLTLRRLARCHPLRAGGYDPVPPRDGAPHGRSGNR